MSDYRKKLLGYCAGKLTGDSDRFHKNTRQSLYQHIRDRLKERVDLYLPEEHTAPGGNERHQHPWQGSSELFLLDVFKVAFADFMLCCLDEPSTGTGMEIVIASNALVPTIAFHQRNKRLGEEVSRMPVGSVAIMRFTPTGRIGERNEANKIIKYDGIEDLVEEIGVQLSAAEDRFREARRLKTVLDVAWSELDLARELRKRMLELGLSNQDMAERLGTSQEMVRFLTMEQSRFEEKFFADRDYLQKRGLFNLSVHPDDVSALRYVNPSLLQLSVLSQILQLDILRLAGKAVESAFGPQARISIHEGDSVPDLLRTSLESLEEIAHSASPNVISMLQHRESARYYEIEHEAERGAARDYNARTVDEWRDQLAEIKKLDERQRQRRLIE